MNSKMYIAVLDEFPDYMTPTLVAHATLGHHLQQPSCSDNFELVKEIAPDSYAATYNTWLCESFRKCVVRVNQKEFDKISQLDNVTLHHENNTLGGKKSCAVVVVENGNIPNVLKFSKLWKPTE